MSKWPVSSLRGKLHIKHGYPFKSEYFSDGGHYIVLTPGNFHEEGGFKRQVGKEKYYLGEIPEDYLHSKGDLIDAMTEQSAGLLGSCAFVPVNDTYLHNQRLGLISTDANELDRSFVYYLFKTKSVRDQIRQTSTGSKVKHTSPERLYAVTAPLPKVVKQREIAAVLAALDAKIDCNNRINAELEAMAKTLYHYWFVQFDFPDDNGKPYKSSGGKMVYNAALKREIPAGWQQSTIGETFSTYLGGTPSRDVGDYWTPGEVSWLSSGENPSTFVVAPDEQISKLGLQNSPAKVLPRGSVILSIVRHLRASILGIEAATNQSVVGIVETETLKHCFVYPYLVREIPRLMALRTGAQQPHINKGTVDESPLVVPSDTALRSYTDKAEPLFLQIQNNLQQNNELAQLRDWLLPLLMNGQVTVS